MATPMGYGTLLECPYNKSHRVQATAMARHLFKCRKMYPNTEFVTCPFNHAHKVAEPELKMHTATCEDRANFDMYKYCITTAAATHQSTEAQEPELIYNQEDPIAPNKVQDNDDECWDDLRIPAYNPQEYCEKAKIIRKATLKTPAEKRAFYEQEMKRHQELDVKIKKEMGIDVDEPSDRNGKRRSRSRSPKRRRSRSPRAVRRRSPSPLRPLSRSKRSRSRSRKLSPARSIRSRRSRSNSRKSRSLSPRDSRKRRRRSRSRSLDRLSSRPIRRSPSPVRRDPYERYDRPFYQRPAYDNFYPPAASSSSRYYGADSYDRYDPYGRGGGYGGRFDYYERYGGSSSSRAYDRDVRPSRRDSRDRDDEEHIYRRDFRD